MRTIKIRGNEYQPERFFDRDIVPIATLATADAYKVEAAARETLLRIFPNLSPDLIEGDRVCLQMAEISQLVQDLMLVLLDDPDYRSLVEGNPEMAPLLVLWEQYSDADDDEFEVLRPEIEEFDAEDDGFLASIAEQVAAAKERTARKVEKGRRSAKGFGDR